MADGDDGPRDGVLSSIRPSAWRRPAMQIQKSLELPKIKMVKRPN
jgi:hypothetical protein